MVQRRKNDHRASTTVSNGQALRCVRLTIVSLWEFSEMRIKSSELNLRAYSGNKLDNLDNSNIIARIIINNPTFLNGKFYRCFLKFYRCFLKAFSPTLKKVIYFRCRRF